MQPARIKMPHQIHKGTIDVIIWEPYGNLRTSQEFSGMQLFGRLRTGLFSGRPAFFPTTRRHEQIKSFCNEIPESEDFEGDVIQCSRCRA